MSLGTQNQWLAMGARTSVFIAVLLVGAAVLPAQEKSFLWQARSENGSLFILGSIHFLKKEDYPLRKAMEDALESSQKLMLEIDLGSVAPEREQQLVLEMGLYRDGTTLRQNVSVETYRMVAERAQEVGLGPRDLDSLKPWLVALTLTTVQLQKLGFDPRYGVDRYFAERAKKQGKPIGGLETLEFQLGLLDQLSKQGQESLLVEALKEFELQSRSVDQIVRFWKNGDTQSLEALLLAGMREFPALHERVIVERNRRWLAQIENMLKRGEKAIVVVGAAHLIGKEGIIELLKQRGYTVEQL